MTLSAMNRANKVSISKLKVINKNTIRKIIKTTQYLTSHDVSRSLYN
jgi:hypothetical protein